MSNIKGQIGAILSILKKAEPAIIANARCFVVSQEEFYLIMEITNEWHNDVQVNERIAAEGYENMLITLSAVDKHRYCVVTQAEPILDEIWNPKAPK